LNSYQIRYFKGLGTSKKEDAKDTFKRLEELKVDYYYKNKVCDDAILLAFEKDKNVKAPKKKDDSDDVSEDAVAIIKCSDKRKNWLSNYDKNIYLNVNENRVSYQDLINKELIHFSIYDNLRSIPSLCDGLKPSQRKILYYMLKRNKKDVIKVAQLSGYESAETAYHHGEASLQGAIINLAQNFVGSNNINLLYPDGNFGSRLQCGKDAASPRYIFTRLSDATDIIFNAHDTPLLDFLNDDGTLIEPEWYLPIIPMVLVNGCEGIGTGYSTYIPSFNPKDIITNLMKMIDDENYVPPPLKPYFQGFNGVVEEVEKGSYITKGKWERLSDKQIKITEVPVGMGITIYKEFLESLIENNLSKKVGDKTSKSKKKKFELKDVQNKTKDENDDICFIVEFKSESDLDDLIKSGTLEKELKLVKSFSTNNMYLFNESLILTKYDTPVDILLDFFDIRIQYYIKRRDYIIKKLKRELLILESKARFISEYIEGELVINKKSKDYIIALLEERDYPTDEDSYDYLLRLPIYSLTLEKINELNKQCENKKRELQFIKNKTPEELWKIDLEDLIKKL
jgi:DNA topoisomerase-2